MGIPKKSQALTNEVFPVVESRTNISLAWFVPLTGLAQMSQRQLTNTSLVPSALRPFWNGLARSGCWGRTGGRRVRKLKSGLAGGAYRLRQRFCTDERDRNERPLLAATPAQRGLAGSGREQTVRPDILDVLNRAVDYVTRELHVLLREKKGRFPQHGGWGAGNGRRRSKPGNSWDRRSCLTVSGRSAAYRFYRPNGCRCGQDNQNIRGSY